MAAHTKSQTNMASSEIEKTNINKKKAKTMSKTWQKQNKDLDSNLKHMSALHKSVMGSLDGEANKMKQQAEKLLQQQLRLAEGDSPEEDKLRAELGLQRRRSSLSPQEVRQAAQTIGLCSLVDTRQGSLLAPGSLGREQCRSAAPRRTVEFPTQPQDGACSDASDDYIEIPAITISTPDNKHHQIHQSGSSKNKNITNKDRQCQSPERNSGSKNTQLTVHNKKVTTNPRRKSECVVRGNLPTSSDISQHRRSSVSSRGSNQNLKTLHELKASARRASLRQPEPEVLGDSDSLLKERLEAAEECRYLRRKSAIDRELTVEEIFAKD